MKKIKAFTLAEVLITLAIIGVVAALTIPSVISNSQQQEFKTGLRKAVSVLNSAITMNMALEGESPYDNADLFHYLQRHMSIISSFTFLGEKYYVKAQRAFWPNSAFYTTDGMRFEFFSKGHAGKSQYDIFPLYENPNVKTCLGATANTELLLNSGDGNKYSLCNGCGSYGLNSNQDKTTSPPCMITVDVNGDRKPNPANVNCKKDDCAKDYKLSDSNGKKLSDVFSIIITDKEAIPYGIAAQKAMYQAQK